MSERGAVNVGLSYFFAVLAASLFFPILAPLVGALLPMLVVVLVVALRRSAGG